jgi:alkylhydroperoxidase family enzyme
MGNVRASVEDCFSNMAGFGLAPASRLLSKLNAAWKGELNMDTFLPPIEKPEGIIKKLVYYFTRRQFGKVLTPLKVHSARMPVGFGLFYGKIGQLDKKLQLPQETIFLIREQVARINICLFCMDIGRSFTIKAKMDQAKFDSLDEYATSPLFSEAERAALDYVTELTRDKEVNPATFARMARHYSERAICEIVWLVATEHVYNMTNIGLNIHSDMLCDISRMKKSAA